MNDKVYEIIKDEYEKLWNYYIQGVQERFKLFDWYFKIVTIPFTFFTSISFFVEKNKVFIPFDNFLGLILIVIYLCGLCIYIIYAKQNALAEKYDISLKTIRGYYKVQFPELADILVIDKLRFSKGRFNGMGSVKLWRGLIIAFFNSIIITISLGVIKLINDIFILILVYFFSIALHIFIYLIMNKNYLNKE